jgi:hypothetical protein
MGNGRPSVFGLQDEPVFPGRLSRSARISFWSVWTLRNLMGSHCGKNSTNMHPSSHQTTVPRVLRADGIVFACFFLDDSCVMPLHALSIGFRMKMIKPAIVTSHDAVKKIVIFDSTPFQQLHGNIFSLKSALLRLRARNLHGNNFPLAQMSTISCITRDYSISAAISPALMCRFSQGNTTRLIGDVFVTVLKIL